MSDENRRQADVDAIKLIRPQRMPIPWYWRCLSIIRGYLSDLYSQMSDDPLERCRWVRFPSCRQSVSNKSKDQLGRAGEDETILFLKDKGYLILHRNIRISGVGELDLVARQGRTLVFFEIKTRRERKVGSPSEAVTPQRRKRIVDKSRHFMEFCQIKSVLVRYDIVSVVWPENDCPQIEHLENAFRPENL